MNDTIVSSLETATALTDGIKNSANYFTEAEGNSARAASRIVNSAGFDFLPKISLSSQQSLVHASTGNALLEAETERIITVAQIFENADD